MKLRLLINSRKPALLKEFMIQADNVFECLSTSEITEDIEKHFKYFNPHGYVFCPDCYTPEGASHLLYMKRHAEFSHAPIFVMGDAVIVDDYEKKMPEDIVAIYFRRPITISNIAKQILAFYEKQEELRKQAQLMEAARKQEEEQKLAEFLANQKKHILIIDDDRNILKLLKAALEPEYDVTTMTGGKMARKFLETRTTDLILLDYEMPMENGPEVYRRLRADERFAETPIVFLTGVAETSKIKEVLALHPQGYILKPIDIDRLNATIADLLG